MESPHDLAWKTMPAARDVALGDAESRALLALSFFRPLEEDVLARRLRIERATVEALIERSLARRMLGGLRLTVSGARRRDRLARAMDRDPAAAGWREKMAAALGADDAS